MLILPFYAQIMCNSRVDSHSKTSCCIVSNDHPAVLSNVHSAVSDAYRRKVFFKYEKRLRAQSPPEKVHNSISICFSKMQFVLIALLACFLARSSHKMS